MWLELRLKLYCFCKLKGKHLTKYQMVMHFGSFYKNSRQSHKSYNFYLKSYKIFTKSYKYVWILWRNSLKLESFTTD